MDSVNRNNFWNDAARCGIFIGGLLGLSYLLETWISLSGRLPLYGVLAVEWLAVFGLHLWLLYRFVRSRSRLFTPEEGFTFGQGYGYVLAISSFGGFLVGIVQTFFLRAIGYANYVERTIDTMNGLIARGGGLPASMEGLFAQTIRQLRDAPEPSVLDTVWGGIFSGLLFGAVFGLIIAAVCARAPKPFKIETDE